MTMNTSEKQAYLQVYYTPYDKLRGKSLWELKELLRQVETEARRAVLAYNWLEGILRLKAQTEGVGE
jgi:hypothetical protein